MNIAGLKQSKFLTRADVGQGVLVTIREIFQDNVAKEGAPEELKWCIAFDELEKPMVLNSTNGQIIASFLKSDETDEWIGHKIVLYDDPSVSFGGKLVGGIRVRAPRGQAAKAAPAPAPSQTKPKPPTHDVPSPKPRPAPVTSRAAPEPEPPVEEDDVPF